MRYKLPLTFNLYISLILFAGFGALVLHDVRSSELLLMEIGFNEADRFAQSLFDQLYTSMRLGGGRFENRAAIERFKRMQGVEEIRIVHGPPLDRQFGEEPDEKPGDDFDKKALSGEKVKEVERRDGFRVVRFVLPIRLKPECVKCHKAMPGDVMGAVSVRLSLDEYEKTISAHTRDFIFWAVGIIGAVCLAVIYSMNKRLLKPLSMLKKSAEAIAGGDLSYRANIEAKDEIGDVGRAFDSMAERLDAARSELCDLNERHSILIETAPDGIVLKDIETRKFIDANTAALFLTGYSKEEFVGLPEERLYPREFLSAYKKLCERWAYDGKGCLYDARLVRKDLSSIPIDISASVVEIKGRKYMQLVWRDISERKGLEEAVRRHMERLEELVRQRTSELNRSLAELEDAYGRLKDSEQKLIQSAKLKSLGEMGAGLAHELNSPLAGILSITEVLLRRKNKEDSDYTLLMKVKDAAVRSRQIILDVMSYSRPLRETFEPISLNSVVDATLGLFSSEIKSGSLEILRESDAALPAVSGNKGQLMEVLLNIIKNARDAMRGKGRIFIRTSLVRRDDGDFSAIEVSDTGQGIPTEAMDKIFDPFFTTKDKGGGLNIGLGLSISKGIVTGHKGRIEASNIAGSGACFGVLIPVLADARQIKNQGGE
ncbi:MAG: ATP-binding protein [Deltaproteobacteria bacterium]